MNILLRELTQEDWELMLAWRNDEQISMGFYNNLKLVTWEELVEQILTGNKKLNGTKNFVVILERNEVKRRVGIVTIEQLEHWGPELGYYIGEKPLWGKGIGKEAVKIATEYIKKCGRDYARVTILHNNTRSIRLVKSLGFKYMGFNKSGEKGWYQKKL